MESFDWRGRHKITLSAEQFNLKQFHFRDFTAEILSNCGILVAKMLPNYTKIDYVRSEKSYTKNHSVVLL